VSPRTEGRAVPADDRVWRWHWHSQEAENENLGPSVVTMTARRQPAGQPRPAAPLSIHADCQKSPPTSSLRENRPNNPLKRNCGHVWFPGSITKRANVCLRHLVRITRPSFTLQHDTCSIRCHSYFRAPRPHSLRSVTTHEWYIKKCPTREGIVSVATSGCIRTFVGGGCGVSYMVSAKRPTFDPGLDVHPEKSLSAKGGEGFLLLRSSAVNADFVAAFRRFEKPSLTATRYFLRTGVQRPTTARIRIL